MKPGYFAVYALLMLLPVRAEEKQPAAVPAPVLAPEAKLQSLKFTLKEAEAFALKNNPQIRTAQSTADAVWQQIREARSNFFPQVYGEVDAVYAPEGTRLAALNAINNPSIYSRQSDGVMVSQLITDFGRTFDLTQSARYSAQAAASRLEAAKAIVILSVDRAYFDLQRAQDVQAVAEDTVKTRKLSSDQIDVLFRNNLKSELDAGFARADLEQAQLLAIQAGNDVKMAQAELSAALGFQGEMQFELVAEPLDFFSPGSSDQLVLRAFSQRPELAVLKSDEEAARRFAQGERAANYPKVTALAYGGINPVYDGKGLDHHYYAAGVNMEIPLANGGRLDAKAQEAALLDQAALSRIVELQNSLARDVRQVLLRIDTARKKLDVTAQLTQTTHKALQLAESRYKLGTSSIVELSQAQLNDTQAQLQAASARYEYQLARSLLNFTTGANR